MKEKRIKLYEVDKEIDTFQFISLFGGYIRIYYKPSVTDYGDYCGFTAYVLEKTICDNNWEYLDDILITTHCLSDGIRHMYFGDEKTDNIGYLFYIGTDRLIKIIEYLQYLEVKYSSDYDYEIEDGFVQKFERSEKLNQLGI